MNPQEIEKVSTDTRLFKSWMTKNLIFSRFVFSRSFNLNL